MPALRTMPAHLTRRLSRLLALLMIYSLVGGSFPPPIAASHEAGHTSAVPAPTLSRATTSARASVYLPIIATSGGSTSTPTPTALPSATPTSIPTGTPGATPTSTPTGIPGTTPTSTPTGIPGTTPTSTPINTPTPTPPAPDTQPPAAPANLRLNEKTDTTIGLIWDASTDNVGVTGYDILIGPALVASTSSTNGTANGLTPDTSYTFTVRAKDAAGNLSAASDPIRIRTKRVDGLPYDPAVIAPPVEQTTVSDFAADTQFLYSGPDAIQTGVAPGTIDGRRVAVLRGLVLTRDDAPLPGVTISVLGHPEYGQTASRADGVFDLAVNGGGLLTLNYTRVGYLPIQRQITAPWRDYAWLPDVALIPLDPAVTELNLTGAGALQVAHGSVVSDTDGVRQATLMFPADVTATLVYSDNTSVPLTTLHVRATEYTVGASGPKAMPGPLPVNSAYTYAAEFSADEAIAAGAKTVRFSRPIVDYTENFLDFPVGGIVPTGYYDRDKATWIPSDNGLVVKIVGVTGGLADLDITGDGEPDNATGLGVTDAERQQLAGGYPIGQELWRVPIPHFTPWDHNWPYGPPPDAIGPNGGPPRGDDPLDDPCERSGSIIECQNQTLGEAIDITGTPFRLDYRSDRVAGRTAARSLQIPLSQGTMPASLDHIQLEITVAGQRILRSFAPGSSQAQSLGSDGARRLRNSMSSGQVYNFAWNGRDAYGRQLQGGHPFGVNIGYVYPSVYAAPMGVARSFGRAGGTPLITLDRMGGDVSVAQIYRGSIGPFDVREQGLGGWTLDAQHTYDPHARKLYLGDGERRGAERIDSSISTFAGFCSGSPYAGGYYGDGGPADDALLSRPFAVAAGSDGSLYIADRDDQRIRRVDLNGIITTVAGTGVRGFSGDGGPAIAAKLNDPTGLAIGPDGNLYILDFFNFRIRRVDSNGIITTVAGIGLGGPLSDGIPATIAHINPSGIAVGPDGSLYIADGSSRRIRRVDPNGIIATIAGNGGSANTGDGGQAWFAGLGAPVGIAVGPDSSLYVVDNGNYVVRRIAPNGIITTVAGGGALLGDGGPATDAKLNQPYGITVGLDSSLYVADQYHNRIRVVRPNGFITTVAGNGIIQPIGDGGPATAASLYHPVSVALRPDGSMYIADAWHHCVRHVGKVVDSAGQGDQIIPSEDGRELYQFNYAGRHLRTLNALTGAVIYTFAYDPAGRLTQITDRDGRATTIERDASGAPFAIVGPDGQRTTLALDGAGHLAGITNPAGETTRFGYTPDGLMTELTDPRGGVHTFAYNEQGRLTRDTNPVGGFTALSRADDDDGGYSVTTTNALGDTTTMRVETLATGDQRRVNTAPNGATTTTLIKLDGTRIITDTRGNVTTSVEGPDPRWGMQAPFVKSLKITTANGQTFYRLTANRTAGLSNALDPMSLRSQTETITINGRTTTTVTDADARTITTIDPSGKQAVTTLDAKWRSVREEMTNFAPKQYAYDPQGRLVGLTQGEGAAARTTTLTYNAWSHLASTTDPLGGTTSYTYDIAGRLLSRTLPTGHTLTFTYDAAGNRTSSTDPQGVLTTYEYDAHNRLIAATLDPDGRAIRAVYTYDLAGNLLTRAEDAGAGRLNTTTQYAYTPSGGASAYALSRVTDPLSGQTQYAYTPSGEISSIIDPLGRTTVLTYTEQGWRSAVTTPGGRTTLTAYNDDAQAVNVTDPRGSQTIFTYDAAGHLKTVAAGTVDVDGQPAMNQSLAYDYDSNSRVIRATDPRGKVSTRGYDAFGRLIQDTDPLGHIVNYAYDALDRPILQTVVGDTPAEMRQTSYTYDAAGRLLAERVDPNGLNLVTQYRYTGAGGDAWNPQAIVDPKGNVTAYHYNSLGLRDATTDALGRTWAFEYDNLGHSINQIDPLGHAVSTAFDALGRKTSLTQDGRTELWSYDAAGALITATDFMSRTTAYNYDADQRLVDVDYPAGTPDVSYVYDASGNLASMTDGLGATAYSYDAINRLRERTRDGRTVTYDYAADDQLARIDYWGHGAAQYDYDDAGRLTSLTPWSASATNYTYRGDGLLAGQTRGNGVTTTYNYDSAGRLTELLHQQGVLTLQDIRYALDANGNRTRMTDLDGATTYAYDALDRLMQVSYPAISGGPGAATTNYDLDAVGNRLSDGAASFTYDASDRIANPGYSYDANGSLLSDGATSYAYDAANRLIQSVTGGITTTYGYDGNGNLIRETANGLTADFVLDERGEMPHILGEVRSDGTETLYAYGAEGFAAQQTIAGGTPQGVQYPLLDGLGSVRHLTDGGGALTLSRAYDVFGAVRHTSGGAQTNLGFTGERMGADGTLYLRARHYSPALGRFLQRDSFGGFAAQPQSLNRYAYAENNPARFTDPSGHCPFCLAVVAGAVIGAGIEYGSQVYHNYQNGKSGWDAWTDVRGDKIGYAAVQGAVIGGVGFVAGPLVGALAETGLLGSVAGGALEGMTAGGLGQVVGNLLKGCAWDSNLTQALLSGGLGGSLGGGLGWGARQVRSGLRGVLGAIAGDPSDEVIQIAQKAKPLPGYYDVTAHGREDAIQLFINGEKKWSSAKDVADWILRQEDYIPGTPVRLLSCNAGGIPKCGGDPVAAQIANELNAKVLAATAYIKPNLDGTLDLVDAVFDREKRVWAYPPKGEWIPFEHNSWSPDL